MRHPSRPRATAEPLEPRRLLAAQLVQDINPATAPSTPQSPLALSDRVLFWTGGTLWNSDGTAPGTTPVHTFASVASGGPAMTILGGRAYFFAKDVGATTYALWQTDGRASGTTEVTAVAGSGGTPVACGDRIYYSMYAATNSTRAQLWQTDGTAAGTTLVAEFPNSSQPPSGMTYYNGYVYFAAEGAFYDRELWRTDGTAAGTTLVKDIYAGASGSSPTGLTVGGGVLYFAAATSANGIEPWRTDGTAAGTYMLRDVSTGTSSSFAQNFVPLNGTTTLFIASGYLFRTDGTTAGTVRVNPVASDAPYSFSGLTRVGATAYFQAYQYYSGAELWRTDGTAAGTVRVKDIDAGGGGSNPSNLTPVGDTVYFTANDGQAVGLWKSDGTEAGTVPVRAPLSAYKLLAFGPAGGARVFLGVTDPVYGQEPYVSDGTAAGTHLIADLNTSPYGSDPGGAYPASSYWASRGRVGTATVGAVTYFGTSSGALWRTDGTPAGTSMVKAFDYHGSGGPLVRNLRAWNGSVYFLVDTASGEEVWRSDGTAAGTTLLRTMSYYFQPSRDMFVPMGSWLYFLGDTNLWRTDGTVAGTTAVTTAGYPYADWLTAAGDRLYFVAGYTAAVYVSDGTAAGTVPLSAVAPGFNAGRPDELTGVGDTLFFTGLQTSDYGSGALWKTDGTAAGTGVVTAGSTPTNPGLSDYDPAYLAAAGGLLYFRGHDAAHGSELWRSDGTAAGTYMVRDVDPGSGQYGANSSDPQWITPGGDGRIYFVANTVDAGAELWTSDGTAAGTVRVGDVNPGSEGSISSPDLAEVPVFAPGDGSVYFVADDGVHGKQVWYAPGAGRPAVRLTGTDMGPEVDGPRPMAVAHPPDADGRTMLLFSASNPTYGRELWRTSPDLTPPSVTAATFAGAASGGSLSVTFDEDVSGSLAVGDLRLDRIGGGAGSYAPASVSYSPGTRTATFVFGGPLPGGVYRAVIPAGAVSDASGNPLPADFDDDFLLVGDHGRFALSPGQELRVRQLVLGVGAQLDVADGAVLLDYTGASPAAAIRSLLFAGRNGGSWDGTGGVVSSSAASDPGGAVGYAEASDLGLTTFDGQAVDGTAVLLKYARAGDANLDGAVGADDFALADRGKALGFGTWVDGDFDYDGAVTAADLALLDGSYAAGTSTAPAGVSALPTATPSSVAGTPSSGTTPEAAPTLTAGSKVLAKRGRAVRLAVNVTNAGKGIVSGRATVRVYFSGDSILGNADDFLVMTKVVPVKLRSKGAAAVFNLRVRVPAALAGTAWHVLASAVPAGGRQLAKASKHVRR